MFISTDSNRSGHLAWRIVCSSLLAIAGLTPAVATGAEVEEGFQPLFDGKSLAGWDGNPKLWSVVDGAIRATTSDKTPLKENEFLIWKGKVSDFVLRLEFKVADRGEGNSGVQYRAKRYPDVGRWSVGGYQADIERTNKYMGILYEERGRGILAMRGEKVLLEEAPKRFKKTVVGSVGDPSKIVEGVAPGKWQKMEVTAKGNHLVHKINGKTTISVIDNDKKHAAAEGLLALQVHRGPEMQIEFRNIRLKKLSSKKEKPVE